MKKILPLLVWLPLLAHTQLIYTPTVLPVQPTTGDSITVIVKTMTPYLGHKLSRTFTISKTGMINIDICNFSGMPAAIQYYTDTFEVGQLSAGAWSVQVNYSISSNGGACTSQSVLTHSFTVQNVTGTRQAEASAVRIYPNPAQDLLYVSGETSGNYIIYDVYGRCWIRGKRSAGVATVDVSSLPNGLYVLSEGTRRWQVVVER